MGVLPRASRFSASIAVFIGALVVASCGPGVNGPPLTLTASSGGFTAPPVNGLAVFFTLGATAPSGVTATVTSSVSAPSGVPAPSAIERQPQSIAGAVSFLYISAAFNKSLPVSALSETLTLTGALPTGASYFVEIDDPSAVPPKLATIPGVVSGNVVTFTNASTSGP